MAESITSLNSVDLTAMHDPYEAFRYLTFRLFASSYVLAIVSSQIYHDGSMGRVSTNERSLGHRPGQDDQCHPVILLALARGHVADRFSRKRVLLITQVPLVVTPSVAILHAWNPQGVSLVVTFSLLRINAVALTFARRLEQPSCKSGSAGLMRTRSPGWQPVRTAAGSRPAASGLLLVFGVAWAYLISGLRCVPRNHDFSAQPAQQPSTKESDGKALSADCVSYSARRCCWQ